MTSLIERLRLNQGEIFGPTMQEAADELERLQRENEELRAELSDLAADNDVQFEELAALKAQSTKPVARVVDDGTPEGSTEWIPFSHRIEPLKTGALLFTAPPTATALVEDFKRRAIEVCEKYRGSTGAAWKVRDAIESLPLIKGEK